MLLFLSPMCPCLTDIYVYFRYPQSRIACKVFWHLNKSKQPKSKSQDQSYEKRCKRGFRDDWKVNRPWLRVEKNANGDEIMFCDFCVKAGIPSDKTSFV